MAADNIDILVSAGGGLNSDDDILFIAPTDSRYRLNVYNSDDSNYNVLTNVLGNTLVDNGGTFTYPGGGSGSVIGFVENKEEKAGIFFVYNGSGEHSIIQYFSETGTVQYILRGGSPVSPPNGVGNILNFQEDKFIDAGIIGNEEDKFLVWTDGVNEPRIVNIQMAINYTAGSGSPAYSSIDADVLRFYKVPLLKTLEVDYQTQLIEKNDIRRKIWQFAVRKKFIDNTYSVLSPYSEIDVPQKEETAYGDFVRINVNTWIRVRFEDPGDDLVDIYQLYFRICDVGSESVGNWYRSNVTSVVSGGNIEFYFYNDGDSLPVDQTDANRIYDYVPDLADHLYIIDSNRVVFGGITEGYDNISETDLDVVLSHNYNYLYEDGYVIEREFIENLADAATSSSISTVKNNLDEYHFSLQMDDQGVDVSRTYGKTSAEVAAEMASRVSDLSGWTGNYTSPNTFFTVTNNTGSLVQVNMVVVEPVETYKSFKCGSKQRFGLIYYFNGKPTFVQTTSSGDIFEVDIPNQYEAESLIVETGTHNGPDNSANLNVAGTPWTVDQWGGYIVENVTDGSYAIIKTNDSNTVQGSLNFGTEDDWDIGDTYRIKVNGMTFYNTVDWEINHEAPAGATHYQWAYLGSNIDRYNYYVISGPNDMTVDGQYMSVSKNIISNFVDGFGGFIDYGFDIQPGDRLKIIGYLIAKRNVILFDEFIDTEIIYVDSSSFKVEYILQLDSYITFDYLVEIYRTKQISDSNGIYEAVSPVFEIYESGGSYYHRGETQDQTAVQPATGIFNSYFADTFLQRKALVNNNNNSNYISSSLYHKHAWIENRAVSILYDSTITSFGKFNVKNEFAKRGYFNKLRWGGKYLDESGVNFMTLFEALDERLLDDRNGRINKMQQIGDTLKVYQERKTNSFYLKTTSSTSADGSQTYVFNDAVMSEARQSVFDYGCTHFSSYVKTVRAAYYFDIINGVVIKDTPGGPVNISAQKQDTYFKNKASEIIQYGAENVRILGGYDEDLDLYLLTFVDISNYGASINETIGFHVPTERWISFYSYLPEYYGKVSGDTALTFRDTELYVQNSNATRNNFFGSQYTSIVDVHANSLPNQIKVYESVDVISTGQWAPFEDGDIEINLSELMQSRLTKGKFKLQEGVYRSEFLRDALVKDGVGGTTFEKSQLIKGRWLRGHEMRVRLRNDDTDESNLRIVTVKSNISE